MLTRWLDRAISDCYAKIVVGEPHDDASHPDYIPSLFPAVYKRQKRKLDQIEQRYNRIQKRRAPFQYIFSAAEDNSNEVSVNHYQSPPTTENEEELPSSSAESTGNLDQCTPQVTIENEEIQNLDTSNLEVVTSPLGTMELETCSISTEQPDVEKLKEEIKVLKSYK